MARYNDIGMTSKKNVDSIARTLFLKTYIKLFACFLILFVLLFGFAKGLMINTIACFFLTIIVMVGSNKIGNISKLLYGGRQARITLRERMISQLKAARVAKMNNEYKTALNMVNDILKKDPQFYEAMFVKAQILDRGFEKPVAAKKYLIKILNNTQKDQNEYNWALSLYNELKIDTDPDQS